MQLVWATIFSYGSAYLFSLGITKSQSSLIWAIAPICGALVQPIVGAVADNYQSRWGRRRPFVLIGAVGIVISLITLAWVGDIIHALAAVLGVHTYEGVQTPIQIATILCITLLNLSIQPLQSGLRALIIDVCPPEQQSVANAWAGRFTGISNIIGYILGSFPLGSILRDNETWRFRFLSLLSAAILVITVLVTVYFIREDDSRESTYERVEGMLLIRILGNAKNGWSSMPLQSQRVCVVQFFSWMGWFGFLFYSTPYVGQLYIAESRRRGEEHFYLLGNAGIRLGTFARLLSAITGLATTFIVPHVASVNLRVTISEKSATKGQFGRWRQTHLIWALCQCSYAFCMFCTLFVSSTRAAIILITLAGVPWGVTQWAPFALLGEEIAMHQAKKYSMLEMGTGRAMESQSGAMMGIHNAVISIPQILAAVGSSVVFLLFEGSRSGENDGIAWVLRMSGVPALLAAYLALRLN